MDMTLREMVGQRMLVGFAGPVIDPELESLIKDYKISNFIINRRNITSRKQLSQLCGQIQALVKEQTGHPALISIDQEGGSVTRLADEECNIPGAMAVASTQNAANAYNAGLITGSELRALGVNFDLAPVLDVNSNAKNPVIGERSYGDTPETVIKFGLEMARGLADGGVFACAKHFPGHGDTHVDSHLALPVIDKTLDELEEAELKPFRAAIDAGIPAVMTSHIRMPKLEAEDLPNTMSRNVMTGLLREKLGFNGLVVSDCLEMNAIKDFYGTAKGGLAAAKAGVDLLCICHTPALMRETAELLYKAAESGELPMDEMEEAVNRIISYKSKLKEMPQPPYETAGSQAHKDVVRKIREEAICLVGEPKSLLPPLGENPLFVGSYAYRSTIASNPQDKSLCFPEWMAQKLGGNAFVCALSPDDAEVAKAAEAAQKSSCVVFGSYNGQFQPGQAAMLKALAAAGVPAVAVALRSPYDLKLAPDNMYKLAAFEYTTPCFEVLADILSGKLQPKGRLSVSI